MLQKLGFPVSFLDFKIQNLVASCNTFPVSLERLMLAHHRHCRSGSTGCGRVSLRLVPLMIPLEV